MFTDVEKIFEKYESEQEDGDALESMSVKIVSGLTDILKKTDPKLPDSKVVNRICEFIGKIHDSKENAVLWDLSMFEKDGGVIISFLKELARRDLVLQIDKIFRHGSYRHPLVNELSCNPMIEDEFNELLNMLQEEYQSE